MESTCCHAYADDFYVEMQRCPDCKENCEFWDPNADRRQADRRLSESLADLKETAGRGARNSFFSGLLTGAAIVTLGLLFSGALILTNDDVVEFWAMVGGLK